MLPSAKANKTTPECQLPNFRAQKDYPNLLAAAVGRDSGLRGSRRASHVFAIDVPGVDRLLLMTDCVVNIAYPLDGGTQGGTSSVLAGQVHFHAP